MEVFLSCHIQHWIRLELIVCSWLFCNKPFWKPLWEIPAAILSLQLWGTSSRGKLHNVVWFREGEVWLEKLSLVYLATHQLHPGGFQKETHLFGFGMKLLPCFLLTKIQKYLFLASSAASTYPTLFLLTRDLRTCQVYWKIDHVTVQESLSYPSWGDQRMQKYGNFGDFHWIMHCLGWCQ